MVQDDWQWPSMRNGSPLALYCAMMASNFAIGPPPPHGCDDPAASAAGVQAMSASSAVSDRRAKRDAAVIAEMSGMRAAPDYPMRVIVPQIAGWAKARRGACSGRALHLPP